MKIASINAYQQRLVSQGLTPEAIQRRVGLVQRFTSWVDQSKSTPPTPSQPQSGVSVLQTNPQIHEQLLLTIAGFIAVMLIIGVTLTTITSSAPGTKQAYKPSTRTLSFSGKLTDAHGMIIAEKTGVVLSLYNSQIAGTQVYSSGVCKVIPNIKGAFETTIGGACGSPIRDDVFARNPSLYLGIKVANDPEMQPRTLVTSNPPQLLQSGISLRETTSNSTGGFNLDENGDMLLSHETPAVRSTLESANFAISSARGVLIQSAADGDITLSASESGQIKFLVGGEQVGTVKNSGDMEVTGNILPTNTGIQDLGSSNNRFKSLYVDNIYPGLFGISGYLKREGNIISTSNLGDELILGSSNRSNARIRLSPFTSDQSWLNAGNFGIGTTNPTFNLDVAGTTRLGGDITLGALSSQKVNFISSTLSFLNATGVSLPGNTVNALAFQTDLLSLDTKNNRIGIGTIAPANKLTIADSQANMSSLWVENTDTGASARGISIKLGFTSGGNTSNEFITFIKGNGAVQGKIHSNGASGVSYTSGGGDFAEYFLKDTSIDSSTDWLAGTPVCLVADGMVRACDNEHTSILGVISSNAAFVGNSIGENDERYVLVGLVGQLPVRVDSRSGIIRSGDPLTFSTTPGVVQTATTSGRIVGFAQERYDGNGSRAIQATIQPGYFEIATEAAFTKSIYNGREFSSVGADTRVGLLMDRVGSLVEKYATLLADTIVVREKLTSPIIETDKLVTSQAEVKKLTTHTIAPEKDEDVIIDLSNPSDQSVQSTTPKSPLSSLLIKGFENHTVASIDAAGNASFSGTLQAQQVETTSVTSQSVTANKIDTAQLVAKEASVAGTLTADHIEASNIADIQKTINDLKNQPLPDSRLYEKDTSVFKDIEPIESLTVVGKASFYDASVANSLMVGTISISDSTITGLSFELKLTALSTINLLDGAVIVSREGNLTTKGELIARGLSIRNIQGTEVASVSEEGKAYFAKGIGVNTFIADATNTRSENELTAAISTNAQSAGTGEIPAGKTNVIIYNDKLTTNSLVYLTSTSKTENQPVYVSRKTPCEQDSTADCKSYFVVTIDHPIKSTATFNWWIIN